jgi:hypothetical protein
LVDTFFLIQTAGRSSPMDRIRQSHGGFYLCGEASVDGDELGGLVSSVLAGCTPPAATSTWTFPVIGNFSTVVKYDYDRASRVSASTFLVNGKKYFSGNTVTNYTGGDDDAMVLGSESTYMTEARENFNATYEKVKTPEGKEVERMVGSSVYHSHPISKRPTPTPTTRANPNRAGGSRPPPRGPSPCPLGWRQWTSGPRPHSWPSIPPHGSSPR